jgi:hypothetical protein
VTANGTIEPDVVAEALRLLGNAEQAELPIRILGGTAIFLHVGDLLHPALKREINDIDFATPKKYGSKVARFFADEGYAPNRTFNAMHGARRLLFYDEEHGRQIDVFVGTFEMCHVLPLAERLMLEPVTLPLAELVMTKLQIARLNLKDKNDVYALLLTHEVAPHDDETINTVRIAELCAREWGLYRTVQLNLERLQGGLADVPLTLDERNVVSSRLRMIDDAIEAVPKSAKWKLRAKVGDKVRWYEEPDEVSPGGY